MSGTCSVCLKQIIPQSAILTSCMHAFCRKCLLNWLTFNFNHHATKGCPLCRTRFTHTLVRSGNGYVINPTKHLIGDYLTNYFSLRFNVTDIKTMCECAALSYMTHWGEQTEYIYRLETFMDFASHKLTDEPCSHNFYSQGISFTFPPPASPPTDSNYSC